jgi:hypothetical protein
VGIDVLGNLKNAEFCHREAVRLRALADACTFTDIRAQLAAMASEYDGLARRFIRDFRNSGFRAEQGLAAPGRKAQLPDR